jgi:hypothetical protein
MYNPGPIDQLHAPAGRSCQKIEEVSHWQCVIWHCLPESLRKPDPKSAPTEKKFLDRQGEVDGCKLIAGKSLKVGDTIAILDDDQKKIAEHASTALIDLAAASRVRAATEIASTLPSSLNGYISSAFAEQAPVETAAINAQKETVATAEEAYNKKREEIAACTKAAWFWGCGNADTEKAKLELERKKLQELNENAQSLRAVATKLGPPGCVDKPCVVGPDGRLVPDERFRLPAEPAAGGCGKNPTQAGCRGTFPTNPEPRNPGPTPPSTSLGSAGDLMKALGQFAPLIGQFLNSANQGQKAPTCNLKASPTNITRPGQPVTLSWTTENAQSAYLSAAGQVGPTGQITVNPQQATSYSMQVIGYPQQQPQQQQNNPFAPQVQQDAYCVTSVTPVVVVQGTAVPGCANYKQTAGYGAPSYSQPQQSGPPQQGQCQVQVTAGQTPGADNGNAPKAQISCQPKIVDVGMMVSISYACQNGAVSSAGEGFDTKNSLSGSATTTVASPGSGSTTVTYGLTCSKDGVTDSAQCTLNVNRPSIVLVANPKDIDEDERTTIGWVTGAMERCVISSPDLSEFTEDNKNNTAPSGSVKTPPLEEDTKFVLTCTTKAGGTKTAETTVVVD